MAEIDLNAFNRGAYVDSVEAKRKADAIVSVLYPNDATPEGKLLRLEQQYFFVSASMQARRRPSRHSMRAISAAGPRAPVFLATPESRHASSHIVARSPCSSLPRCGLRADARRLALPPAKMCAMRL